MVEMSFIEMMKDKLVRKLLRIVLHQGYEGQVGKEIIKNCPSSRL